MLPALLLLSAVLHPALGWGGLFNRFSPEMLSNLGYGGHGSSLRVQPFLQRVRALLSSRKTFWRELCNYIEFEGVVGEYLIFKLSPGESENILCKVSKVPGSPTRDSKSTNQGPMETLHDLQESEIEGPCYGKRCTANEHCCAGYVCVDVDGGGSCMFPYGLGQGELCRRHSDCETGLVCSDTGDGSKTCMPPFSAPKQYSEECTMSSECDIHRGLCCQFQRRHRQVARKMCSYFTDPMVCIGPVASDHAKIEIERTAGEKRITGKTPVFL